MKKSYVFWLMGTVHFIVWCMLTYTSASQEFNIFRHVVLSLQPTLFVLDVALARSFQYQESLTGK